MADLFDFAVLHGGPGINPGRYRRDAAVLLPHMGFKTRLEQHHILQCQQSARTQGVRWQHALQLCTHLSTVSDGWTAAANTGSNGGTSMLWTV